MNTASTRNQVNAPHETSELFHDEERIPPAARVAVQRVVSDLYSLWCLCDKGACRRARRCKGNPKECLETLTPLLASEVIDGGHYFFEGKEQGLSFEELYERHPDEIAALGNWRAAIDRRPLPPGARDIPKAHTAPNGQRKRARAAKGL